MYAGKEGRPVLVRQLRAGRAGLKQAGARSSLPALVLTSFYSAAAISLCERCRRPDCCPLYSGELLSHAGATAAVRRRSVKGAMPTDPTGTKRGRTKKEEQKTPPKYGPPTGGLTLVSFRGVTVTANKLANLPIIQ